MRFLRPYLDSRVLAIGVIAFANGIPALLTGSTLAVWLKEYGLSYSAIGLFTLVHLPYTFKFLWAPILDQIKLPYLSRFMGQRRSWLFLLQGILTFCLLTMAQLNPSDHIMLFAGLSLIISVAAASQHVLLLAYQVQTIQSREWGVGESMSVFGFRMGILASGAGALYLASSLPWSWVYMILASVLALGILVILLIPEPNTVHQDSRKPGQWFKAIAWDSYRDFMSRRGWLFVLGFMVLYRMPDHLLGSMTNLFFLEIGFSKDEIAAVAKVFGLCATIAGGFCGGLLLREWSYSKTLLFAGIFHGATMACFLVLNQAGYHQPTFYTTVALEHFSSGLGLTAFFSYQLTQCNPKYAATQLALMTATAAIGTRIGGLASGFLVEFLGWDGFFWAVTLSAIPGVAWVLLLPYSKSKTFSLASRASSLPSSPEAHARTQSG